MHGKFGNINRNDSRSDCADERLNCGFPWKLSMELEGAEVDVGGVGQKAASLESKASKYVSSSDGTSWSTCASCISRRTSKLLSTSGWEGTAKSMLKVLAAFGADDGESCF